MQISDDIITDPAIADRRDLEGSSCDALLREIGWGVLSTIDSTTGESRPYCVPVSYAYDGTTIYMASGPGRKRDALEASGRVCLTVFNVLAFDRWTSVVVEGRATAITNVAERVDALCAFGAQRCSLERRRTARDVVRLLSGRIFRITPDQVSGRVVGPIESYAVRQVRSRVVPDIVTNAPAPEIAHDGNGAARTMESIRRLVRALRTSSADSERHLGLSAAQLFALRQIASQPHQSMSELAKRTLTSQSSVSEVITRLVDRGFVSRETSARDRRRAELALTETGARLLARVPETIQEKLAVGFDRLTPIQQAGLAGGLEAWLAESGLSDVPATMFFEPTTAEAE
jgi:DNA-binding MarR family transcriptional regulator/nitroimidazol reductase NimA-like FMN-containing flavoprotein (pyridoxamine 5'-phosphate oxidase superfamily)